SGYLDVRVTVRAIKAGAENFFTKPISSDDLLPAIERALAHHQASREQQTKRDVIHTRIGTLTPRERQVFDLVIRGQTNKQAARALGCTERTIKAHRHNVMEKMQVKSLAELVSIAERNCVGYPTDGLGYFLIWNQQALICVNLDRTLVAIALAPKAIDKLLKSETNKILVTSPSENL